MADDKKSKLDEIREKKLKEWDNEFDEDTDVEMKPDSDIEKEIKKLRDQGMNVQVVNSVEELEALLGKKDDRTKIEIPLSITHEPDHEFVKDVYDAMGLEFDLNEIEEVQIKMNFSFIKKKKDDVSN